MRSNQSKVGSVFIAIFFAIIFGVTPVYCGDTSVIVVAPTTTSVLDMYIPAQKCNQVDDIIIPINVRLGDEKGRIHIHNYDYIVKIVRENLMQVGEDIPLELAGNRKARGSNQVWINAHGKAILPENTPAGNYYLFVYQVNESNQELMPFACSENEALIPCDFGLSCLCLYSNKKTLAHEEDYRLIDTCSEFWCCDCKCSGKKVNNVFHIFDAKMPGK